MKTSAREKKILYMGIVVAVAISIYYAATSFSPEDGQSLAGKIETQESLLRRQKELIRREDSYKKRIEDAENEIEKIQELLLPGNNAGAANTELQRILGEFANRNGVVITQKSNQPERKVADSDSLVKVSVQINVDCQTIDDLVDFLIDIKNYDKFLKVEQMAIDTVQTPQTPQSPQRRMTIRRPLTIVVAGYISVPPPPDPAAKPGENPVQTSAYNAR